MIIVKLKGGLGNQMFQYAFGKALSLTLNQRLFFNNSYLAGKNETTLSFTAREFELSIYTDIELKLLPGFLQNLVYSKSKLLSKLISKLRLISFSFQVENEYLDPQKLSLHPINIFEGYFQSQNYFSAFSDTIRSNFRFPEMDDHNKLLSHHILSSNSVAIHIRRGDYFSNLSAFQYHGILPIEYYKNSIELLKTTQPDLKYFVFTDDADWARRNFIPEYPEALIVEGNVGADSWKDMALMTFAKHHIISNSSFSWWGAWLSENSGIKIAPKNWFNPEKVNFDIHSIVPENWILMC